jgi:hypothetical protein
VWESGFGPREPIRTPVQRLGRPNFLTRVNHTLCEVDACGPIFRMVRPVLNAKNLVPALHAYFIFAPATNGPAHLYPPCAKPLPSSIASLLVGNGLPKFLDTRQTSIRGKSAKPAAVLEGGRRTLVCSHAPASAWNELLIVSSRLEVLRQRRQNESMVTPKVCLAAVKSCSRDPLPMGVPLGVPRNTARRISSEYGLRYCGLLFR